MRILAIDATGVPGTIAVGVDEAPIVHMSCDPGNRTVELLVPTMMACLRAAGVVAADVDLVAVNVGPGGFTGTRAGVAVARAFCAATGAPAMGLSVLEIIAVLASSAGHPEPLAVVRDAQRGQLIYQLFDRHGVAMGEPLLRPRPDAGEPIRGDWRTLVAIGDIGEGLGADVVRPAPTAEDLVGAVRLRLAQGAVPVSGTTLRPFYLRPPDAAIGAGDALVRVA